MNKIKNWLLKLVIFLFRRNKQTEPTAHLTPEHKAKISKGKTGKKRKPFTKQTKRKMKLAQKLRRLKEKRLKVNGTE